MIHVNEKIKQLTEAHFIIRQHLSFIQKSSLFSQGEVHFFNFDSNIYDMELKIEFLHRLRDEKKFKGLESLKSQLQLDMKTATNYINSLDE